MRSSRQLASILAASAVVLTANPARSEEDANAKNVEHTPMACDAKLTVDALSKFKAPKASKPYEIELSVPSLANSYIEAVAYGARKAAKEAGVRLSVHAGNGFLDPASQIRQVENALTRKPNALLINPADPNGMTPVIDSAIDNGVPVFDVGTLSSSKKSYKVVQDDYAEGMLAADTIAKMLPEGGSGIVMGGPANATWARRRVAGFTDRITAYPNVKVSAVTNQDIKPEEGLPKFMNAAQAHPKVDWVYAVYNILLPPSSLPAEYAKVNYIGGAFDPIMVTSLKDGIAQAALPNFPVWVGYLGVAYAVQKLDGGSVPLRNCIPVDVVVPGEVSKTVWADGNLVPAGATAQ